MVKQYVFDQIICEGAETKYLEFKRSSLFSKGTFITNSDAEFFVSRNIFHFNEAVRENTLYYLEFYFMKHFSAFMNLKEDKSAKLILGVNDYGVVKGIPYRGTFPFKDIQTVISNCIKHKLKFEYKTSHLADVKREHTMQMDINSMFDIKIRKVQYERKPDSYDFMAWKKRKCHNDRLVRIYKEKIDKINHELHFYSQKMNILVRSPTVQNELLQYIQIKSNFDPVLRKHFRKRFKKNEFPILKPYDILLYKHDKMSVFYWLTKYKDERILFLKSLKPKRPYLKDLAHPNSLIAQISPLIPNWMNHNTNMNLYVIEVHFYPQKIKHLPILVYYKDNDKYIYSIRSLDSKGNPCCIQSE